MDRDLIESYLAEKPYLRPEAGDESGIPEIEEDNRIPTHGDNRNGKMTKNMRNILTKKRMALLRIV